MDRMELRELVQRNTLIKNIYGVFVNETILGEKKKVNPNYEYQLRQEHRMMKLQEKEKARVEKEMEKERIRQEKEQQRIERERSKVIVKQPKEIKIRYNFR